MSDSATATGQGTTTGNRIGAVASATGWGALGVVLSVVAVLPVVPFVGLNPDGSTTLPGFVLLFSASYAGIGGAVLLFLSRQGRGLGYLDVAWPDLRDLLYVVVGVVGGFGALFVVGYLVSLLELPTTPNAVLEPGLAGDTTFLLLLIPLVLLVNAPVEELLYRNVIQKSLYRTFSRRGAVVVTSLIFALVHIPAYYNPNLLATGVSLVVIFVGSLVFGGVYARTDSIVVPSLVHGLFNAIQIGLLYLFLGTEETLGLVIGGLPV